MDINVLFDEGFEDCLEESWLESIAGRVLTVEGVSEESQLSLVVVGQDRIQQLNKIYLGRDGPTDVISFPMISEQSEGETGIFITPPDGIQHLGEVVISYPQAVIQAEEQHHNVKKEIAILVVHGVLHLLGYDHDIPDLVKDMKARETEIIKMIEDKLE